MSKKYKSLCGLKLEEPITVKQYIKSYYALHKKLVPRYECKYCKKMVISLEKHQNSLWACKKAKLKDVPIILNNFTVNFGI